MTYFNVSGLLKSHPIYLVLAVVSAAVFHKDLGNLITPKHRPKGSNQDKLNQDFLRISRFLQENTDSLGNKLHIPDGMTAEDMVSKVDSFYMLQHQIQMSNAISHTGMRIRD